ncbi:hypothetical protein HanRHA438_Chr11g0504531 [Helianthus annuus]|nr:hypothetical protein HanIR_Chr11g0529571 [Helianthus annuus]KAJ0803505.1 hypothetical protein HanLR1_Chr00c1810g0821281 [Helianthus annuus]KAJ0870799.1 hypothetical protein HanRHA438_Chr11g0504531 [Helianthus annuus]
MLLGMIVTCFCIKLHSSAFNIWSSGSWYQEVSAVISASNILLYIITLRMKSSFFKGDIYDNF